MKRETLYIMVRVSVEADLKHLFEIVGEVEGYSKLTMTDTANVNILETEIFMSRIHNPRVHQLKSQSELKI